MNIKNNEWTFKEILKGKTFTVIVLTLFFTYFINSGASKLVTYYMNIDNTAVWDWNFNFGFLAVIFIPPALFISLMLIKTVLRITGIIKPNSYDPSLAYKTEREASHGKQFKWYNTYGIIVGYMFLTTILKVSDNTWANIVSSSNKLENSPILSTFIQLFIMIMCFVIAFKVVKQLNKLMIGKTQTNKGLLEDISNGFYDKELKTFQNKQKAVEFLKLGKVSSIRSALVYLKIQKVITGLGVFSVIITLILFIGSFGVLNFFMKEATIAAASAGGGPTFSSYDKKPISSHNEQKNTNWERNLKEKKAQHAQHYANKQANYNPKSHEAKSAQNRANKFWKDAKNTK